MTRLTLAESKRHAEREKKLQVFYEEKNAADLAAAKERFAIKLAEHTETWQKKFATCQEKHADELAAQEEIWSKKVRMLQRSVASLQNPDLTESITNTQTRLLDAASKFLPGGTSPGGSPGKLPPLLGAH